MKIEFITAESALTRKLREGEFIRFPQLTVPLLASLTPADIQVHHTDEIISEVDFSRPVDLVAITCNTPAAPHAYELAVRYRERGIPVVIGGPHPTLLPVESKRYVDAVVVGEAEEIWPRLIEDFRNRNLQPFYRSARPPCLHNLPHARRDLLNGRWYSKGVLFATRGCPNSCEYCTLPHLYHRKLRCRPVEEVAAEVASIKGKPIVFWDDNIAADPAYAKSLFRAITPCKKWWTGQATVKVGDDEELLCLAAESGCKAFFIGFESFSQASLDDTNKSFNRVGEYRELVARLHYYGIAVQAGMMFGFDGDSLDVFERTVEAANKIGIDNATISLVVPFPGARLFGRLVREGRILTRDWSKYNGKTDVVFRPNRMTAEELQAGFEWASRQFYSWSSIWTRLSRSRTGLEWNILRNVGYHRATYRHRGQGYNPARNSVWSTEPTGPS
ncbi:MAG: B12-binding domain-containing radical SAM protein [Chloroflexi bacterium]|nr:B12-binding domain-containing radical SAM protein [Chloroflexota bacterium]